MQIWTRGLVAGIALATVAITGFGGPAHAAGSGVGDVSDAVVYDGGHPLGSVLADLVNRDDRTTTVALPFPINFFGTRYDALCITTNGTVSPVASISDTCSNQWDVDLDNLARLSGASVIGALSLDLDPSAALWPSNKPLSTVSRTGSALIVTTVEPHGLATGDTTYLTFGATPGLYPWPSDYQVLSVIDPTSFTVTDMYGGADFAARPVAGYISSGPYLDTNGDGLPDDGVGNVKSVYFGDTVINGQRAVVVTWYRIPNYRQSNDPSSSATLQLILTEDPTVAATTSGSDFSVQFNFGTVRDLENGYSATDPSQPCDSVQSPQDCRWSAGWARYDPSTTTTDVYDLFATRTTDTLIDTAGSSSLVANRLNSPIPGRYTWRMVGGVTVGFAVPAMDGTDSGTLFPAVAPSAAAIPSAATAAAADTSRLPDTGVEIGTLALIAGGSLVIGAATVVVDGRLRRSRKLRP